MKIYSDLFKNEYELFGTFRKIFLEENIYK